MMQAMRRKTKLKSQPKLCKNIPIKIPLGDTIILVNGTNQKFKSIKRPNLKVNNSMKNNFWKIKHLKKINNLRKMIFQTIFLIILCIKMGNKFSKRGVNSF